MPTSVQNMPFRFDKGEVIVDVRFKLTTEDVTGKPLHAEVISALQNGVPTQIRMAWEQPIMMGLMAEWEETQNPLKNLP
jgi:hypothetical protein